MGAAEVFLSGVFDEAGKACRESWVHDSGHGSGVMGHGGSNTVHGHASGVRRVLGEHLFFVGRSITMEMDVENGNGCADNHRTEGVRTRQRLRAFEAVLSGPWVHDVLVRQRSGLP